MAKFNWDKNSRQTRVASHGSEPSEFTDITKQIATAKGLSKSHGPWLRKCAICEKYIPEEAYDEHRQNPDECRPFRKLSLTAVIENAKKAKPLLSTFAVADPITHKVRCPVCTRLIHRHGIEQHNKAKHGITSVPSKARDS